MNKAQREALELAIRQKLEERGQVLEHDETHKMPPAPYIVLDRRTMMFVRRVYAIDLLALARELGVVPGEEVEV